MGTWSPMVPKQCYQIWPFPAMVWATGKSSLKNRCFCPATKSTKYWPICSPIWLTFEDISFLIFRDLCAPLLGIFLIAWQETPPWYFSSLFFLCNSFSFCYQETLRKAGPSFYSLHIMWTHLCLGLFVSLQHLADIASFILSLCPPARQLQSPWSFCDSHFAFFYYPFLTQQRYGVSIFLVGPGFLWSCSRLLKMTARLSSALFLKVNDLLVLLTTFYLDSILCSLFGLIIECFRKVIW